LVNKNKEVTSSESEDPEAERKRRQKLQQQKILQQFQDKQKVGEFLLSIMKFYTVDFR
jgi:hypothetical protein